MIIIILKYLYSIQSIKHCSRALYKHTQMHMWDLTYENVHFLARQYYCWHGGVRHNLLALESVSVLVIHEEHCLVCRCIRLLPDVAHFCVELYVDAELLLVVCHVVQ